MTTQIGGVEIGWCEDCDTQYIEDPEGCPVCPTGDVLSDMQDRVRRLGKYLFLEDGNSYRHTEAMNCAASDGMRLVKFSSHAGMEDGEHSIYTALFERPEYDRFEHRRALETLEMQRASFRKLRSWSQARVAALEAAAEMLEAVKGEQTA